MDRQRGGGGNETILNQPREKKKRGEGESASIGSQKEKKKRKGIREPANQFGGLGKSLDQLHVLRRQRIEVGIMERKGPHFLGVNLNPFQLENVHYCISKRCPKARDQ